MDFTPIFKIDYLKLEVKELIGRGGFGAVYLAEHSDWQIPVAVKKCHGEGHVITEREKEKFIREARNIALIKHKNIVSLYGLCVAPEFYGLVMEYLPNGSLGSLLSTGVELTWSLRCQFIREICEGMNFLHKFGPFQILHMDLKVENILLSEFMVIKISDFGLSKVRKTASVITTTEGAGTITHIPPEHLKDPNRPVSEKFDVYSFAIVLWEISSREMPYAEAYNLAQVKTSVELCQARPNLDDVPDDAPKGLKQLMEKCWHKDPVERPNFCEILPKIKKISECFHDDMLMVVVGVLRTLKQINNDEALPEVKRYEESTNMEASRKKDNEPTPLIATYVKVLHTYEPQSSDELALNEGDIVSVLSWEGLDEGWWKGELNGKVGVLPNNFVTALKDTKYTVVLADDHVKEPRKPHSPLGAEAIASNPGTKQKAKRGKKEKISKERGPKEAIFQPPEKKELVVGKEQGAKEKTVREPFNRDDISAADKKKWESGQWEVTMTLNGESGPVKFKGVNGVTTTHLGQVVIAAPESHSVLTFNSKYDLDSEIRFDGKFPKQFKPWDVAVTTSNKSNKYFMSDIANHQVVVYQQNSKTTQIFCQHDNINPERIALLHEGFVVTDSEGKRVVKYDMNGESVAEVKGQGQKGQIINPWGVVVNSVNNVLVSDQSGGRGVGSIKVYSDQLHFLFSLVDGLYRPYGLSVDLWDNVYSIQIRSLGGLLRWCIVKYTKNGEVVEVVEDDLDWGSYIAVCKHHNDPRIIVSHPGSNCIQVYTK